MPAELHPQVQALLSGVLQAASAGDGPPIVGDLREANTRTAALLGGPGEPVSRTWDTVAETSAGSVPLRWYDPPAAHNGSLLVYVHGGGWVAGTLDSYDVLCRALSLRTGRRLVSVAYDLSPESIYPRAFHQVVEILRAARNLARHEGLDVQTVAAAGDSAGGCLIAGALHHLSTLGEPLPCAAVLLYPVTDASFAYASYDQFGTGYSLTTARMRWFWEQYLGTSLADAGPRLLDPCVAPIQSSHLGSFPPTLVITAGCDPLHDEGKALAHKLELAGAQVRYLDIPGQIHGFLRFREALTDPISGPDAVMREVGTFLDSIR